MKNVFFTTIVLLFVFIINDLCAQTIQYGRVVEINSKGKTIPGVSVAVPTTHDSQPTATDANGVFRLVFSEHKPGDVVRGLRIQKDGYEVVNHHIVHEGWTLTEKDTLKVVLAPQGSIEEARSRYYHYLEESYLNRFDSTSDKLHELYAQQLISEQEFNELMEKALADLNLAFQSIDFYADQLARLNQDDMGDIDFDAMLATFVDLPCIPMKDSGVSVTLMEVDDFEFFFKGLNFIESSIFFGDFYLDLDMKEEAVGYYTLALQMCEILDGYEGTSFTDQIKTLKSVIAKINK